MVDGMNKMGITIPETIPNKVNASLLSKPARSNMIGSKTATAELTKDALARTEVIGRVALNNGFSMVCGLANFPPRRRKHTKDAVKEKR